MAYIPSNFHGTVCLSKVILAGMPPVQRGRYSDRPQCGRGRYLCESGHLLSFSDTGPTHQSGSLRLVRCIPTSGRTLA